MTKQEFDALWQRTEAAQHAERLLEEYPDWKRNRRRNLGFAATVVAVVAVAVPLLINPLSTANNDNYTNTYCNRPDLPAQYWIEMADELLIEN